MFYFTGHYWFCSFLLVLCICECCAATAAAALCPCVVCVCHVALMQPASASSAATTAPAKPPVCHLYISTNSITAFICELLWKTNCIILLRAIPEKTGVTGWNLFRLFKCSINSTSLPGTQRMWYFIYYVLCNSSKCQQDENPHWSANDIKTHVRCLLWELAMDVRLIANPCLPGK